MLGVFAEFETNLRRERQLEGIAKAKAAGVYQGGKRRIDPEAVFKLRKDGKGPTEIAKALKISRMHVYRLLAQPELRAAYDTRLIDCSTKMM
jgi:DNA invertase Pin-like site-specific DNA recombinase